MGGVGPVEAAEWVLGGMGSANRTGGLVGLVSAPYTSPFPTSGTLPTLAKSGEIHFFTTSWPIPLHPGERYSPELLGVAAHPELPRCPPMPDFLRFRGIPQSLPISALVSAGAAGVSGLCSPHLADSIPPTTPNSHFLGKSGFRTSWSSGPRSLHRGWPLHLVGNSKPAKSQGPNPNPQVPPPLVSGDSTPSPMVRSQNRPPTFWHALGRQELPTQTPPLSVFPHLSRPHINNFLINFSVGFANQN